MFRSIVVPIDLAEIEISRIAIATGVRIAKDSGGCIALVNVVPIMPVMMLDTVPVSYETEVAEKSEASLAELAASLDLPADRVTAVVRIGGGFPDAFDIASRKRTRPCTGASHRPALFPH